MYMHCPDAKKTEKKVEVKWTDGLDGGWAQPSRPKISSTYLPPITKYFENQRKDREFPRTRFYFIRETHPSLLLSPRAYQVTCICTYIVHAAFKYIHTHMQHTSCVHVSFGRWVGPA